MKNGSIETTNSYKYLGFLFTPSGEICSGLKDLRDRAMRAYHSLKNKMGHFFRLYPTITLDLFDSLIKPILLYSSDFWGCLKMPKNNPVENMYMAFCKTLLGVQKQTSNTGTHLELGTIPIMFFGIKNCIKNWHRIHKKKEANSILLSIHEMATECNLPWPVLTKHLLDSIGIGSENNVKNIQRATLERLKDIYHQKGFEEITSASSKLRTYAKFKTDIGKEEYLDTMENIWDRTALTKFRLSNHDLMIEKGRHEGLDEHQRWCPFCEDIVETEQHFLLECNTFGSHRTQFFTEIGDVNPDFGELDEEQKFCYLLSEPEVARLVGNHLNKTLAIRRFLLEYHRQTD